jgi:NAD(P)H-hydrate epimerase
VIPLLTRAAARALDRYAIEVLGLPGVVLMENAGAGATRELVARFADRLDRVCIVGGPGQNGGDAWVVARHLALRGLHPNCFCISDAEKVRGDAKTNLDALRALGVTVTFVTDDAAQAALGSALRDATLIVDGFYGTGLDRPITGRPAQIVALLNEAAAPVVALDLPSGVDADTGAVLGVAVRAALTLTFAAHKRGLHQHPGVACAGDVVLVGIGAPLSDRGSAYLVDRRDVARCMPARAADAHKGTAGHIVIFAGSPGHTGAAVLAGLGALRGGAGLVTIAPRPEARAAVDAKVLELMTAALPAGADAAFDAALSLCEGKRAAVIGPGLGAADGLARRLACALPVPAVLDADALTALEGALETLRAAPAPRVLTPHPGEAARLLGIDAASVQADRYAAAEALAERSGHIVVLKGARTIVAAPGGALRVCTEGTPALGVAGTGDVLAGLLGAALASRGSAAHLDVVAAGVVLHALAGELAARADRGLLAHEVAEALPSTLSVARASST